MLNSLLITPPTGKTVLVPGAASRETGFRRSIRRNARRKMASEVSKIGTPIASRGMPTDTRYEFCACEASGSVDRTKPMYMEPESPRKTDAGW